MQKISFLILVFLLSFAFKSYSEKNLAEKILPSESIEIDLRNEIILFAKNYLGTPYRYAGANPVNGFDCSGFVFYVFKNFNINLPHSSKAFNSVGTDVKPEDFKVGDVLVFYGYKNATSIGHVGIICEANGMHSKFIHSSSGKIKGVTVSELGSEMYTRRFYKCVDIIDVNR